MDESSETVKQDAITDDMAGHREAIAEKVAALRASEVVRYDEREAAR